MGGYIDPQWEKKNELRSVHTEQQKTEQYLTTS